MEYWNKLNWLQKTLIGCVVIGFVIMMPELLPLIDMGGIELIFGFIVLNIKNVVAWFNAKLVQVNETVQIIKDAFLGSALARPKTFIAHASVCTAVLVITGSLVLSVSFLLPVIMVNGLLV